MSVGEWVSVIGLICGLLGAVIGVYIKLNTDITSVKVQLCAFEKQFNKHEDSNSLTFGKISATLEKINEMQVAISKNTENVANMLANFDEHKRQNDSSFEMIMNQVKQNRSEQRDDHKELKELITNK